jgi:hypothetical protein
VPFNSFERRELFDVLHYYILIFLFLNYFSLLRGLIEALRVINGLSNRNDLVNIILLAIRGRMMIIRIIKTLKGRLIPIIKVRKARIVVRD